MNDRIKRRLKGIGAIAELRKLVRSCDHLGFEVVEVEVSGGWAIRGSIVSLKENIVGLPVKKIELAPGVFLEPTEFSDLAVTAERPAGHRPERDLYDETEPDRAGIGAGHRIELDTEADARTSMSSPELLTPESAAEDLGVTLDEEDTP